ncbi:MAG: phytoene desaturase family protein [Jatrophihabitans sp.]
MRGPDAVVIGAGHNGLVAANVLADAGWDVLVCEATGHVGGAVRSAQPITPGFTVDLFSAFYPLAAASPVLADLDLDAYGLRWSHPPAVLAHVFADDRCAVLSRDREVTAHSVSQFASGDGAAWMRLAEQWDRIGEDVVRALFRPFPPIRPAAHLARTLGLGDAARLARTALLPARRLGTERFDGAGAAMLIAGSAMHADVPTDSSGSGAFGWLLTMLGQSVGWPVPRGGAGQLSAALVRRLTAKGGQIRTEAEVARVLIERGSAVGVALESGETVRARRAVLADVNAPALFGGLVGHERLPARFVDDLHNFQWDTPTLKIDWALRAPIGWTAGDARRAGTVQLGADMDGLTSYSASLTRGEVPERPFIVLGQMTTADASRSPAGTESAWGYTHLPIGRHLSSSDIDRHAELIERTVERQAPGFIDSILDRVVQSPARLEQQNPNLVHGAINGGTSHLHQQLIFRPAVGLGGAATPVDRLFLAGSSAHPGGGVHGGPGSNAARAALLRAGRLGWATRQVSAELMRRLYR